MSKKPTKSGEKKNVTSPKMRDLPAKPLGPNNTAYVKGGKAVL